MATYNLTQEQQRKFDAYLWLIESGVSVLMMKQGHRFPLPALGEDANAEDTSEPAVFSYEQSLEPEELTVPIRGAFVWRPQGQRFYGATVDTEMLTQFINTIAGSDKVSGVVFEVDSPGGDARGIAELHEAVKNCAAVKPTKTINVGQMCSAAYYGFCGSNQVLSETPNSYTGSIGCYSILHTEKRFWSDRLGIDFELVSSGGVKGHGVPLFDISDEYIQQNKIAVDAIANEFRDAVRNTRANINGDAFNGFHWSHKQAQAYGLVDGLATREKDEEMNKELTALLTKLSAQVASLDQKVVALEARDDDRPTDPKPEDNNETDVVSNQAELDLVIQLGVAQGRITPGNLEMAKKLVQGMTTEKAKMAIDAMAPVIHSTPVSDTDASSPETDTIGDQIAEAFGGRITAAEVNKYGKANSFSWADGTLRQCPTVNGVGIVHKKGTVLKRIEFNKPGTKFAGAEI